MDKRGMNVPQASSGRGAGFLAGLGQLVTDHFSGRREDMRMEARDRRRAALQDEQYINRKATDLVTKAMGYDIDLEAARKAAPVMETNEFAKIGSLEKQRKAEIRNISDKPKPKRTKKGTPKQGTTAQPSPDAPQPESSTGGMKPAKTKTRTSAPKTTKPRKTAKKAAPAVQQDSPTADVAKGVNTTTPKKKKIQNKPGVTVPKKMGSPKPPTGSNGNMILYKKGGNNG